MRVADLNENIIKKIFGVNIIKKINSLVSFYSHDEIEGLKISSCDKTKCGFDGFEIIVKSINGDLGYVMSNVAKNLNHKIWKFRETSEISGNLIRKDI